MKQSILTLIFALFVFSLSAQWGDNYIKLSETITKETKNITDFDKIEISEDFKVFIRFSETVEKVEIEANENLHELIQVRQEGSRLIIDTKSYSHRSGDGWKSGAKERLVAYITAKKLTEISAVEDVVIELEDKLYADHLSINLNEDCTLEGNLEVEHLDVDLNEDSVLDIYGSAKTMRVDANEDSKIEGLRFVVDNLDIDLNEDSEATLTVNGEIDLSAKGDSYFHYKGDAKFTRKKLRGDSEVRNL